MLDLIFIGLTAGFFAATAAMVLALMTALAVVMGRWLARSFSGEGHWVVERLSYRALGVDPAERNRRHLMLDERVVQAVAQGRFHIWAADTAADALTLPAGLPFGERDAGGHYPADSLLGRAQRTLQGYRRAAQTTLAPPAQGRQGRAQGQVSGSVKVGLRANSLASAIRPSRLSSRASCVIRQARRYRRRRVRRALRRK